MAAATRGDPGPLYRAFERFFVARQICSRPIDRSYRSAVFVSLSFSCLVSLPSFFHLFRVASVTSGRGERTTAKRARFSRVHASPSDGQQQQQLGSFMTNRSSVATAAAAARARALSLCLSLSLYLHSSPCPHLRPPPPSLTRSLAHSLVHSLRSLVHSLVHSLVW